MKKLMTLCCVYDKEKILLGQIKKEGVLKDRYNGFGGKVEEGETVEQAAVRELGEECSIFPLDMKKCGIITFEFKPENNPFEGKPIIELHIFSVTKFEGEVSETNEMKPRWFFHNEIPYANMWPDDQYWLPLLLADKKFTGKFYLSDPKTIEKYKLKEVDFIA